MIDCPQCNELWADLKVAMDQAEAMSKCIDRLKATIEKMEEKR